MFGESLTNLSFYVRDSSGVSSAIATVVITVTAVEDAPVLLQPSQNSTGPLSPVYVPLHANDAEGDPVTLTLARMPANGKIFLPYAGRPGAQMLEFSGILDPSQMLRQAAKDVLAVSSWYQVGWRWHPFQILGAQGVRLRDHILGPMI